MEQIKQWVNAACMIWKTVAQNSNKLRRSCGEDGI